MATSHVGVAINKLEVNKPADRMERGLPPGGHKQRVEILINDPIMKHLQIKLIIADNKKAKSPLLT